MVTDTDSLRGRLAAAQSRERAARADAARLRREMQALDRRRETQRLCTLGRAWEAWGASDERVRGAALRWLRGYVTRDTDRAVLSGTPWDVTVPPVAGAATDAGGGRDGQ